jgi:hypothetical protein
LRHRNCDGLTWLLLLLEAQRINFIHQELSFIAVLGHHQERKNTDHGHQKHNQQNCRPTVLAFSSAVNDVRIALSNYWHYKFLLSVLATDERRAWN